jgi:uncharacterized protein (TIGR04141 family)
VYKVARDFVAEVNDAVGALVTGSLTLPKYDDDSEAAYNQRVAAADLRFALMDRRNIAYGGGRSAVEFCDLFTRNREFVHVKRYGGSAPLSHLFSQGEVSAELFAMEEKFRDKVRNALPASHKPLVPRGRPEPDDFEVVFGVVTPSPKGIADSLPFFSRVNLRNRARALRARGFKVSLVKISVKAKSARRKAA